MKYETPELTALSPAINAIQNPSTGIKPKAPTTDSQQVSNNEVNMGYADWE
jgi:hypothetical protein